MKLEPVAWIDEFGNTFPLAAYNGGKAWRESHKHNWKPLYAIPEGYVVVPVEVTDKIPQWLLDALDQYAAVADYDKLVERSFGAMTIADAEYVPSEEMITAYLRAQHQYCHEADQRGEVEYSRKACVAGLKAALRSRN